MFPSDLEIAKNPNFGKLKQPEEHHFRGTLFAPNGPYYEGGAKILKSCAEFRLVQDYSPEGPKRVEWSFEIYRLFMKSSMRINDAGENSTSSPKHKIAFAAALSNLSLFYNNNRKAFEHISKLSYENPEYANPSIEGLGVALPVGATLGRAISDCLEAEDTDQAIKDLTALFGVTLRAVARSHGKLPDKRHGKRPKAHDLIRVASELFREYEERPVKQAVQLLLIEHYGFVVGGKNQTGAWNDLFNRAGLSNLPEVDTA